MSKARICDRCGVTVTNRPTGLSIKIRAFKYHRFSLDVENEYIYDTHDLCPKCMKDYQAFMNGALVLHIDGENDKAADMDAE